MKHGIAKWVIGGIAVSSIAVSGCALMQESNAEDTETLLLAAGFRKQIADTPEKLERIKSLQQHVVFSEQQNGTVKYLYADADGCNCLFIGSDLNYQRYKELEEMPVSPEQKVNPALNWYWP